MGIPGVANPEPETDVTDEKQVYGSGPGIRCPLCGWVPGKGDRWMCGCGHLEYIRHGRCLPRSHLSVDFDGVPLLSPLVAAFGLV